MLHEQLPLSFSNPTTTLHIGNAIMSAPYLLSRLVLSTPTSMLSLLTPRNRTLDPIFALSIGGAAFWVRIRREERERWHLAHPNATTQPGVGSFLSPFSRNVSAAAHSAPAAVDRATQYLDHVPTPTDTWATLVRRVRKIDVRSFDIKSLWQKREKFGIVDPNS